MNGTLGLAQPGKLPPNTSTHKTDLYTVEAQRTLARRELINMIHASFSRSAQRERVLKVLELSQRSKRRHIFEDGMLRVTDVQRTSEEAQPYV